MAHRRIWGEDGVLARLRAGVGPDNLPEEKIVSIPALKNGYYRLPEGLPAEIEHTHALLPNMVNLLPVKNENTRAITAKPFGPLSAGDDREHGTDVYESAITDDILNGIIPTYFVDAWYYHLGLGGVHCATNARRAFPTDADWWNE